MPIKGLTDRGLSFPEIGQIRKGAPKPTTGKPRPGKDLKYFRVEFAEGEEETAALFTQKYGDVPNTINVILPFNEITRCWSAFLEAYTAGRMVARSDGEKILYQVDTKTGDVIVVNGLSVKTGQPVSYTKDMEVGRDYKNKIVRCKPNGRLRVFVPELARAAYLTAMTTSEIDIANISEQLEAFKLLNAGQIAGIPLVLRRRPKMVSVPMPDGKRVRQEKWMLSIEADTRWVALRLMETKRLALPGNGTDLPPESDKTLEGEIVEEKETSQDDIEEEESNLPANERPYAPATVKDRIITKASRSKNFDPTPKQQKLLRYALALCFPSDDDIDDKRHTILQYLVGDPSSNKVTGQYFTAIIDDWLAVSKDSGDEYTVDPIAAQEAQAIFAEALKIEGQQEMEL